LGGFVVEASEVWGKGKQSILSAFAMTGVISKLSGREYLLYPETIRERKGKRQKMWGSKMQTRVRKNRHHGRQGWAAVHFSGIAKYRSKKGR